MNARRRLIAAHEAPHLLGVPAATVRQWARRRHILAYGLDRFDRPLYDLEEIRQRHAGSHA